MKLVLSVRNPYYHYVYDQKVERLKEIESEYDRIMNHELRLEGRPGKCRSDERLEGRRGTFIKNV